MGNSEVRQIAIHPSQHVFVNFVAPHRSSKNKIHIHPSQHALQSVSPPRKPGPGTPFFPVGDAYVESINVTIQKSNVFALKKLTASQEYQKELRAHVTIRKQKQDHLAHLLFAYQGGRMGSEFGLVFHWAEGGNLGDFWQKHNPNPTMSQDWVCWMAEQCRGLADGLRSIHNSRMPLQSPQSPQTTKATSAANNETEREFGRHGDIKPQNILWFRDDPNRWGHGVLKITDFGLASFHSLKTGTKRNALDVGATSTFVPPEYGMQDDISRPFDCWSLGCVYLNFIVWAVSGSKGITEFGDNRSQEKSISDHDRLDTFWCIYERTSSGNKKTAVARLKSSVRQVSPPSILMRMVHLTFVV